MAGQKRTRSGAPKPPSATMTDSPPCGQAHPQSSTARSTAHTTAKEASTKPPSRTNPAHKPPSIAAPTPRNLKRPRLPPNTTISKRPLHHRALPTPFSSAAAPKELYITASSPFVPACKRIRALLAQIRVRTQQSRSDGRGRGSGSGSNKKGPGRALEANGRLSARDVEASIAEAAGERGKSQRGSAGEEVFLKATGRAIPRALELGVEFQGDEDCRVRVEMGSVRAIDDVEVNEGVEGGGEGTGQEDEVPETRIRTLSTVTVCIGLK